MTGLALLGGTVAFAGEPTCPLTGTPLKYKDHVITVKVKVDGNVDEKVSATFLRDGKPVTVSERDKDGNISVQVTPQELRSMAIINKDGHVVTPSQAADRETAAPRNNVVVTGRTHIQVGRTVINQTRTSTVHVKGQAEINYGVTRQDVNGAKPAPNEIVPRR